MKLVKFSNGKYGIRKWSWLRFCFSFAVINSYLIERGEWRNLNYNIEISGTLDECAKVIEILRSKSKRQKPPKFRVVTVFIKKIEI
jgi:hypothetical protein